MPFLGQRLQLAPSPPDVKQVPRLIAELDDDRFTVREKSSADLAKIGRPALLLLKKALEGEPSPEVRRRIEELLENLDGIDLAPERLRRFPGTAGAARRSAVPRHNR